MRRKKYLKKFGSVSVGSTFRFGSCIQPEVQELVRKLDKLRCFSRRDFCIDGSVCYRLKGKKCYCILVSPEGKFIFFRFDAKTKTKLRLRYRKALKDGSLSASDISRNINQENKISSTTNIMEFLETMDEKVPEDIITEILFNLNLFA